jgi:hypothetical protein
MWAPSKTGEARRAQAMKTAERNSGKFPTTRLRIDQDVRALKGLQEKSPAIGGGEDIASATEKAA